MNNLTDALRDEDGKTATMNRHDHLEKQVKNMKNKIKKHRQSRTPALLIELWGDEDE